MKKMKNLINNIITDRKKLFISMIIPVSIIASVLFVFEFSIAEEPPYLSLLGFFILIGAGIIVYFSSTSKVFEEKEKSAGIRGYFGYLIPNIVISTLLFTFVSPPEPPYLLVFGLIAYLIAYTVVFFMAVRAVYNSIEK